MANLPRVAPFITGLRELRDAACASPIRCNRASSPRSDSRLGIPGRAMLGAAASLQPRRTTSQGGKLNSLAEFDSAMKSMFAKTANGVSPTAEALSSRRNLLFVIIGAVVVLGFFLFPSIFGANAASDPNLRKRFPDTFRIAVIADLDKKSRRKDDKGKEGWHSKYMTGTLHRTGERYSIEWDAASDVFTSHNEAGRGAELSELVLYNRKLLTFDDRTGIMFEVANFEDSGVGAPGSKAREADKPALIPRQLFMEGDGATDKGMKIEWATLKDGLLWIGSFGKEYTDSAGNILHANNLWVKVMSEKGVIQHVNWQEYYDRMRGELGYPHPAYLLHEAVTWSPYHRQWFVLPRRISKDAYDEALDERKGANTIIQAAPDFSTLTHSTVGEITPERGFSSFKFLPGSRDTVIVALKSEENSATDAQTSYLTIYGEQADGSWRVLLEETELPGAAKFEGLEVIDPPPY